MIGEQEKAPSLDQLIDAMMDRPDVADKIAQKIQERQKVGAEKDRRSRQRLNPQAVVEAYGAAIHEEGFVPGIPEGVKNKGPLAEKIWLERWYEGRSTSGQRVRELMSKEAPVVVGDVGGDWHEQRD